MILTCRFEQKTENLNLVLTWVSWHPEIDSNSHVEKQGF